MAEFIINNSQDIITKYFISEQEKYNEDNKNKMIDELTKNLKNNLIKDLNGEELFTKDYKKDYYQQFKQLFISSFNGNRNHYYLRTYKGVDHNNRPYGMTQFENAEKLFDYFFSPILKKLDDNEYIIGLYGECDKYIIAFTNRLNIIKYYNENYIKTGVYSQLVDTDCNARDDKNYYLYMQKVFKKNTEIPVSGVQKILNDLLLNDLQIDLINNMFDKLLLHNYIIYSTKLEKEILYLSTKSNSSSNLSTLINFSKKRWCTDKKGYAIVVDYYLHYSDIINHIVYMFKTYWTGKFLSPYAKKIENDNIRLTEEHIRIYEGGLYKKQKQDLDDKILLLQKTTIKEREVTNKIKELQELEINVNLKTEFMKEKEILLKKIQSENKTKLKDIVERELLIEKRKLTNEHHTKLLEKEYEDLNKEKEKLKKFKELLLEKDL
jgi:hypothetical protein